VSYFISLGEFLVVLGFSFQHPQNVIPISPFQWNIIETITNSLDDEPHYHPPRQIHNNKSSSTNSSQLQHQIHFPTTYIKELDSIEGPKLEIKLEEKITSTLSTPIYRENFPFNNISHNEVIEHLENPSEVRQEDFYNPIIDDYGSPLGDPIGINGAEKVQASSETIGSNSLIAQETNPDFSLSQQISSKDDDFRFFSDKKPQDFFDQNPSQLHENSYYEEISTSSPTPPLRGYEVTDGYVDNNYFDSYGSPQAEVFGQKTTPDGFQQSKISAEISGNEFLKSSSK